jgi:signal transduction histidine kinase/ActR/RegA family two-component response regulator
MLWLIATAVLLVLCLSYVTSQYKAAQDALLEQQHRYLRFKTSLSRIERLVLLARNEESTLLIKGGAEPVERFEERMAEADQGWRTLEESSHRAEIAGQLEILQETIRRYRSAVDTSIEIVQHLGRAGQPGLLQGLADVESSIRVLFDRLSLPEMRLRFVDLQLREQKFSDTLHIGSAEALLRDTATLAQSVQALPNSPLQASLLGAIEGYRDMIFKAMEGALRLELATSQSDLRFGRVLPEIRTLESQLNEAVLSTAPGLDAQRRVSMFQIVVMISGVFLIFLLLIVYETRSARAWIALEAQFQEAQKVESLNVLTGGIAHDFNNLLVGVLGNAELALTELPAKSTPRRYVEAVITAAERSAELVKQMLAYAGRGSFVLETCDLGSLVEEMERLLGASISSKASLSLSSTAAELPAVEIDTIQIRQVVMNLITNASDALCDQEGLISVVTGVEEIANDQEDLSSRVDPGRYAFVEVSDNGCGMDASTRRQLFEPFFTTKPEGRGLGMASVLGIVHGHRGAIRVHSKQGEGSIFRLLLPASSGAVRAVKPAVGVSTAAPIARSSAGLVLVVDDDETCRLVAEASLKSLALEVLLAEDGQSAVALFEQHASEIDLVLLDLNMPGLDGSGTLRELRQICPGVKVILCSAYSEEEASERFHGLAGYLEKPYRPERLGQKVLNAIDSGRASAGRGSTD